MYVAAPHRLYDGLSCDAKHHALGAQRQNDANVQDSPHETLLFS